MHSAQKVGQDQNNDVELEDEEDYNLPLSERLLHTKWRVRLEAFRKINELFYNDYVKFE